MVAGRAVAALATDPPVPRIPARLTRHPGLKHNFAADSEAARQMIAGGAKLLVGQRPGGGRERRGLHGAGQQATGTDSVRVALYGIYSFESHSHGISRGG